MIEFLALFWAGLLEAFAKIAEGLLQACLVTLIVVGSVIIIAIVWGVIEDAIKTWYNHRTH